tara:strand:+ start:609 stop:1487 length:879 start_codon:yes stop_codon:yes gene_type:complete
MEQIGKTIGRRKYEALKALDLENITDETLIAFNLQFKNLTVGEGLKMIKDYEKKFTYASKEQAKKVADYFERINQPEKPKEKKILTKEVLWDLFSKKYFDQNGIKYSKEDESLENIKPLIYYFVGDYENFKRCSNLSRLSVPSFSKGLLLIGGYGTGKTSVMKAIQSSLAHSNVSFKTKSTNDIVTEYEGCTDQIQKDEFWRNLTNYTWNFDDMLTEREASNYGKVNIMKDVLEIRYDKKNKTYGTCNFNDNYPNDMDHGLMQFGEKYGSRVYDRLFSMFNIIEFKGKSYRK